MDSVSDKMFKFYINITNPQVYDIINQLNKNLKMHFILYFIRKVGLKLKLGQQIHARNFKKKIYIYNDC